MNESLRVSEAAAIWGRDQCFLRALGTDTTWLRCRRALSPIVNAQSSNLLGFVNPCDLLPQADDRASNQGEYFYAIVPRTSDGQTPEQWYGEIRPTLIHETKHVVSDAERFAAPCTGDCTLEIPWLEEATATLAQELYLRTFSPQMTFRGEVTYANSLACDLPSGRDAGCSSDHPVTLTTTGMAFLYDYLDDNEGRSFLGQAIPGDGSWYGGGWMFARWAADQYAGSDEGAFLKSLVQDATHFGLGNLTFHTGHSAEELLTLYNTALAAEVDSIAFTPLDARLSIPSWNLRDVFAGLESSAFGSFYAKLYPITPHLVSYGTFTTSVSTLYSGSAAIFDLSGTQGNTQLLAVEGAGGTQPPSSLRLAIVRMQ